MNFLIILQFQYMKRINGKNNSDKAIKEGRIALNKEDFKNKGKRKKKKYFL